jgi:hypothetical protein
MGDLTGMNDDDLARWQAGWQPGSEKYIRAEKEWERRRANHEFGLQRALAKSTMIWSAVISLVGVIVGALISRL